METGNNIFSVFQFEVEYGAFFRDDALSPKSGMPRRNPVYVLTHTYNTAGGGASLGSLARKDGSVRLTLIKTADNASYSKSATAPELMLQCYYPPLRGTYNVTGLRRDAASLGDSWYSGAALDAPRLRNEAPNPLCGIHEAAIIARIAADGREMEMLVLHGKRAEADAYRHGFAVGAYDPYIELFRKNAVGW